MSAPTDPTNIEIEWQLDALDLRPVERWLATRTGLSALELIPGLAIVPGASRRLVDLYVDTEDWRIGRAGYVLRVRRRAGRAETTLKDLSSAAQGLRRRLEVTQPLPASGLSDLDREGEVGWRLQALAGARPLKQVLEVRTRRHPFDLKIHGERIGELALDDTVIAIGQERRRLRLTRVEVEVLPAWVEAMQPFVERMRRECGLQPATLSKFEAGLMAAGLSIPGPPELGPTEVSPTCTLGELAYRVLRKDASTMLVNVAGTRLGEDIEALHQMRVATRRMRAAIDMFAEVLPVRAGRLNAELGWLAALLGDVRDLDIQIGRFDDWTENMPGDHREALDELADLLIGERGRARVELLEALDSKRYERLVTGLTTMLMQGPSIRFSAGRALSVTAVPDLIGERHDASRKAARRATRSGVASDYHRLRIRCKRLRYSLEFASGLYGGELKAFVRQMTRLQDTLGAMQDAEVASARLQAIALTEEGAGLSRSTIFAMGGVAGRYHSEAERLLAELPALVDLLEGKQWARTRSVLTGRRKQAFSDAMASAATTARPPRIAIAGHARPAIAKLPSGLADASRPAPPGRSQPQSEPTAPDQAAAADELKDPRDEGEPSPPAPPPGGRVATTITPIRRQVAPS
jgi:CHAD domain-containing protein